MTVVTITRPNGRSLQFDAVLRIDYNPSNIVSKKPAASGETITENSRKAPLDFTVIGQIVESPMGGLPSLDNRITVAVKFLEDASGEPLIVSTPRYGDLSPCFIESYPHSTTIRNSEDFSVSMTQAIIPETSTQFLPPEVIPPTQKDGAPPEEDAGQQTVEQTSPPEEVEADNKTWAASGVDKLFSAVR